MAIIVTIVTLASTACCALAFTWLAIAWLYAPRTATIPLGSRQLVLTTIKTQTQAWVGWTIEGGFIFLSLSFWLAFGINIFTDLVWWIALIILLVVIIALFTIVVLSLFFQAIMGARIILAFLALGFIGLMENRAEHLVRNWRQWSLTVTMAFSFLAIMIFAWIDWPAFSLSMIISILLTAALQITITGYFTFVVWRARTNGPTNKRDGIKFFLPLLIIGLLSLAWCLELESIWLLVILVGLWTISLVLSIVLNANVRMSFTILSSRQRTSYVWTFMFALLFLLAAFGGYLLWVGFHLNALPYIYLAIVASWFILLGMIEIFGFMLGIHGIVSHLELPTWQRRYDQWHNPAISLGYALKTWVIVLLYLCISGLAILFIPWFVIGIGAILLISWIVFEGGLIIILLIHKAINAHRRRLVLAFAALLALLVILCSLGSWAALTSPGDAQPKKTALTTPVVTPTPTPKPFTALCSLKPSEKQEVLSNAEKLAGTQLSYDGAFKVNTSVCLYKVVTLNGFQSSAHGVTLVFRKGNAPDKNGVIQGTLPLPPGEVELYSPKQGWGNNMDVVKGSLRNITPGYTEAYILFARDGKPISDSQLKPILAFLHNSLPTLHIYEVG